MNESLRARIAALAALEPAFGDDLALRGALVELLDRTETHVGALRLPAELARARLAAGVPLLDRLDLPPSDATRALFERLTVAMLAEPDARAPAEALLVALQSHRLHAEQLVAESAAGHDDHLATLAMSAGLPSLLVASLADLAARPLLGALAQRLRPALSLGAWERGYCPVCGGRPLLSEERGQGDADTAWLRCGRCATGWAHALLRCPACGAEPLATLERGTAPGAGEWTVAGCDACRSYLKLAAEPRPERLAELLVDDLVTFRLDQAALERGYRRPTGLGRRLEHGDLGGEELDDD